MRKLGRKVFVLVAVLLMVFMVTGMAFAGTEEVETQISSAKAIAASIAIAIAAAGGAFAMGIATAKASEAMARQPEIKNDIRTSNMLGLVFIETTVIYALLTVILIIFVL